MIINQWRDGAVRVTRSDDVFYNRPLEEITLYHFASHRVEVEPHEGAFSVKFVLSGSEDYALPRRHIGLNPTAFLLINEGETYGSEITRPSESLSIFYRRNEVCAAARAVSDSNEKLLDDPERHEDAGEVIQIPMTRSAAMNAAVARLVASANLRDHHEAENGAQDILTIALSQSFSMAPPTALKDIIKRSTRDALLARVHRARVHIDDMGGRKCRLDDLADIACLSKYHFLRVFRDAYGETPLAYARRRRLEAARRVLEKGGSRAQAARCAEFSDIEAFGRAYHRAFQAAVL